MLYEHIFSWGHSGQAFLRYATALFEVQTRQRQQYFEHCLGLWGKMREQCLAAGNVTNMGNVPWTGWIEVSEWLRKATESYAEGVLAGFGKP